VAALLLAMMVPLLWLLLPWLLLLVSLPVS
jgi:hypothetical protein